MLKIKRIIHIIKVLKKALDVKTIKEVDIEITDFYERNGVIENKHRICSNCKHYHTMNCPNSSECYSISYKPFYEKKIEEIK